MYSFSHKNHGSGKIVNNTKNQKNRSEPLTKKDERERLSKLINTHSYAAQAKSETGSKPVTASKTVLDKAKTGGTKLPGDTRMFMQSKFNYDFSDVKVHTDGNAVKLNRSLNAQAFTYGKDIFFNEGRFDPGSEKGKKLLTHELTHVVQQNANAVQKSGDALDQCITEEYAQSLSNEELQMEIELVTNRMNDVDVNEVELPALEDNLEILTAEQNIRNSAPKPLKVGGKVDSKKIIRVAWTFDDGPTPLMPSMIEALGGDVASTTWFIMYDKLLQGPGLDENLIMLKNIQDNGGEIGMHSFNQDSAMSHAFWFPSTDSDDHSYSSIDDAMAALKTFYQLLTDNGLVIKFVRLPGGLISELTKYLNFLGVSDAETVARKIIAGEKPTGVAGQVVTDFEKNENRTGIAWSSFVGRKQKCCRNTNTKLGSRNFGCL